MYPQYSPGFQSRYSLYRNLSVMASSATHGPDSDDYETEVSYTSKSLHLHLCHQNISLFF